MLLGDAPFYIPKPGSRITPRVGDAFQTAATTSAELGEPPEAISNGGGPAHIVVGDLGAVVGAVPGADEIEAGIFIFLEGFN